MGPKAVIVGLHHNGLAVARALGRQGVEAIAVDENVRSAYAKTRYATPVGCADFRGLGLIATLRDIGRRFSERPVLILTTDRSVLTVSEHRAAIEPFYRHSLPSNDLVVRLMNKSEIARVGESMGFRIPRTWSVDSAEEFERQASTLPVPCILKPQVKTVDFVRFSPKKAFFIRSLDELRATYRLVAQWDEKVVIQEWIQGPDTNLVFALFYFDHRGDPAGAFTGRKVRQFIPHCGTACSAEPCDDGWVLDAGIRFFQSLDYRGFGAIEFKRGPNGEYFLVEPTVGRTEHIFALAAANGVNLPYIGYRDMAGLQPAPQVRPVRPVRYLHARHDWQAARAYRKDGDLTTAEWLRSLMGRKEFALFAWDDPAPFLYQTWRKVSARPLRWVTRSRRALRPVVGGVTVASSRMRIGRIPHRAAKEAPSRPVLAVLDWLRAAQDASNVGGVSRAYGVRATSHFPAGWQPAYPETTGYIIPTLFTAAQSLGQSDLRERAVALAKWTLDVQLPDGGISGGVIGEGKPSVVFNTGMVLKGWCHAYSVTHDATYLGAMKRAVDFLVRVQDTDGAWRRASNYKGEVRACTYDVLVCHALLLAADCLEDEAARDCAVRNVRYALSMQQPNGWFRENALQPQRNGNPLTHTIGYAIEGLLECGLHADQPEWVQAGRAAADGALGALRPSDGFLAGELDATWSPAASWCCLTGSAQLAGSWLRLYDVAGEQRYLDGARAALAFVTRCLDVSSANSGIRGGVAGSEPIHERYGRHQYINWGAKYLVDALLLLEQVERRWVGSPDQSAGKTEALA